MYSKNKYIYWINLNRFDQTISKIPRLSISESLIKNGFKVVLLTGFLRYKFQPRHFNLKIVYFKTPKLFFVFKFLLNFYIFIYLLNRIEKKDILFVSPESLFIALLLKFFIGCRLHLDIRTTPVELVNLKTKVESVLFWYIPIFLFNRFPDTYSFISLSMKNYFESFINRKINSFVIWTSGVDFNHFSKVALTKNSSKYHFNLTYLGVVTENRGINNVIKSIPLLNKALKSKFKFNIIGEGPYLKQLKQLCKVLDVVNYVNFYGYIEYVNIPNFLCNTDFFICPLPDRLEWNVSSPIKIFEYIACARPMILTPISAHKSILKNSNSVIWTDGSTATDFARAIQVSYKYIEILKIEAEKFYHQTKSSFSWEIQGDKLSKFLISQG